MDQLIFSVLLLYDLVRNRNRVKQVAELVVVESFQLPVKYPPQRTLLVQSCVDNPSKFAVQFAHVFELINAQVPSQSGRLRNSRRYLHY